MFKTASTFLQHRSRIIPGVKRPRPQLPKKLRTAAGQAEYVHSLASFVVKQRLSKKNAYELAAALKAFGKKDPFGRSWTKERPLS
jgi:hypothetical protein